LVATLVRLLALQSIVNAARTRLLGYLDPPWPSLFPADLRGLSRDAVPRINELLRVHPLLSFCPLQSHGPPYRPDCSRSRDTSPGVSLSFATSTEESTPLSWPISVPHRSSFRPQRSSRSRRLTPPRPPAVCFTREPRPRFLFRGFPRQPADRLSPIRSLLTLPRFAWSGRDLSASSARLAFRALLRLPVRGPELAV
jgi:hypothetical protein